MNRITKTLLFVFIASSVFAQTDKDQLALKINAADEANTKNLTQYIWKRKSDVLVDGVLKVAVLTEFSYDETGKLQAKAIDAQTTVKQQRGLRGRAQKNALEDKADYVGKALQLSIAYTFMSKGELLDFIGKSTITESNGTIEATADNVYVKGDKLTVKVDAKTYLYLNKKFSSFLDKDPIDGVINYEKFSSGTNHVSVTTLNMPAQKTKIDAKNQDYTVRVK